MSSNKSDDRIVGRLRAAQQDAVAGLYAEGVADGQRYVEEEADQHQLHALATHTPSPHPEQDVGPCASPAECDCIGVPDPAGVTPTPGTVRPEPARYERKGRLRPGNRRISRHEVRVLLVFRQSPERWLDNAQVAEAANINPRTARLHTAKLVELGVLDVQRVFPASKFRLGRSPGLAGRAYLDHWEQAREALGINDVAATATGR